MRVSNSTALGSGFHPSFNKPIDDRFVVTDITDLVNPDIWNNNNVDVRYSGMVVTVTSGEYSGVYVLYNINFKNRFSPELGMEGYEIHKKGWNRISNKIDNDTITLNSNLEETVSKIDGGEFNLI